MRILLAALLCCFSLSRALAGEPIDGQFKNYPAKVVVPKQNAKPILSKKSGYANYRSRILASQDEKPNFAGHYVVIPIGCGTECLGGVLFDVLTGNLYPLPEFPYGGAYIVSSRFFVANCNMVEDPPSWLTEDMYEWNEYTHEFDLIAKVSPNTYYTKYCPEQ